MQNIAQISYSVSAPIFASSLPLVRYNSAKPEHISRHQQVQQGYSGSSRNHIHVATWTSSSRVRLIPFEMFLESSEHPELRGLQVGWGTSSNRMFSMTDNVAALAYGLGLSYRRSIGFFTLHTLFVLYFNLFRFFTKNWDLSFVLCPSTPGE